MKPKRIAAWWYSLEDLNWPSVDGKEKIEKYAKELYDSDVDTVILYGAHFRFDWLPYFTILHSYIKAIADELHKYGIKLFDHHSVNLVHRYSTVEEIFEAAKEKNEAPFIIICDEIEDPHNLGAIIRTAESCGAHGVIIPKRRSASLNSTVAKTSAGALEYIKVARVTNIANTIDMLKENGVWVFGAAMDGKDYKAFDYSVPTAIVIGNEGSGIGTLTRKKCDEIISLPMLGKINSLNASVAAGILMYEVIKHR